MEVLIITDKAKTLDDNNKASSILKSYSGSFKQIRIFYNKLVEIKAKPTIKILLSNGKILDAKDTVNKVARDNIKALINKLNKFDFIVLLLDKSTLEVFNKYYSSKKYKYSKTIFISAPKSIKKEVLDIFKYAKINFYSRVGVARIGKENLQTILNTIKKAGLQ